MNQDFGLSLTPANARRLLRLQQSFNFDLPLELSSLAQQDRIGEDAFDAVVCPFSECKRQITQFLLDCDLRGVVQRWVHPEFSELALLNAVRLAQADPITVLSSRNEAWKIAARRVACRLAVYNPFDIAAEAIDQRRHGVLLIDANGPIPTNLQYYCNEFARTIIYDPITYSHQAKFSWAVLAHDLFPTMPHPLYRHLAHDVPSAWAQLPTHAFALFYNVCIFPEFVAPDTQITIETLTDTVLKSF